MIRLVITLLAFINYVINFLLTAYFLFFLEIFQFVAEVVQLVR